MISLQSRRWFRCNSVEYVVSQFLCTSVLLDYLGYVGTFLTFMKYLYLRCLTPSIRSVLLSL